VYHTTLLLLQKLKILIFRHIIKMKIEKIGMQILPLLTSPERGGMLHNRMFGMY
jgi:hypothetical protein